MRHGRVAILAALPALLAAAAPAAPAAADTAGAGTYVVLLRSDAAVSPDAAAADATARGGEVVAVYRYAVRGYAAVLPGSAVAALRSDPSVDSVTPNAPVSLATTQVGPPWGLDRIDQRTRPLSGTYTYGATGAGVKAYVLDTGIRYSHVEFGGRAVSGFDAIDGGPADDCHGHGTHVAGTIGGTTYGVAKQVRLVGVRVLDCSGGGDVVKMIEGIDWVTQDHLLDRRRRPAVANMSIQSSIPLPPIDAAVSGSIASGVTYSVAAGNFGRLGGACLSTPGRVTEAMTIGATDVVDDAAWFSNYGPCVDWYAPGADVLSAYHTSDTATTTMSGTSMAAPHNAGVAAQYLQLDPLATPAQVTVALATRLTQSVVDTPDDLEARCNVVLAPVCNAVLSVQNDDLLYSGF